MVPYTSHLKVKYQQYICPVFFSTLHSCFIKTEMISLIFDVLRMIEGRASIQFPFHGRTSVSIS